MEGSLLIFFLIIYLGYRNGLIAKLKGKSPIVWVLITIASYLFFYILGVLAVLIILMNTGQIDLTSIQNAQDIAARNALSERLMQVMGANPIHYITVQAFGLGGYLLVRYILERMPTINIPKDNEGVV
ncbi:MAG: hypothetical protein P4L41_09290 [Flavipsychrobacter sp.]|nr:hypothetical protein [Flavipsychrobacter sp.]